MKSFLCPVLAFGEDPEKPWLSPRRLPGPVLLAVVLPRLKFAATHKHDDPDERVDHSIDEYASIKWGC